MSQPSALEQGHTAAARCTKPLATSQSHVCPASHVHGCGLSCVHTSVVDEDTYIAQSLPEPQYALPAVWSKQSLTAIAFLQVLVYHDLLGMMQHPHHAKVTPKFCKQYAHVGTDIEQALVAYNREVKQGQFPSAQFSPYSIPGRLTQPSL